MAYKTEPFSQLFLASQANAFAQFASHQLEFQPCRKQLDSTSMVKLPTAPLILMRL